MILGREKICHGEQARLLSSIARRQRHAGMMRGFGRPCGETYCGRSAALLLEGYHWRGGCETCIPTLSPVTSASYVPSLKCNRQCKVISHTAERPVPPQSYKFCFQC